MCVYVERGLLLYKRPCPTDLNHTSAEGKRTTKTLRFLSPSLFWFVKNFGKLYLSQTSFELVCVQIELICVIIMFELVRSINELLRIWMELVQTKIVYKQHL